MGQMADYQAGDAAATRSLDAQLRALNDERFRTYNNDFAGVGPMPAPVEIARAELDRRHKNVVRLAPGLSYTDTRALAVLSLVRAETGAARDETKHEIARLRELVEFLKDRIVDQSARADGVLADKQAEQVFVPTKRATKPVPRKRAPTKSAKKKARRK